MNLQKKYKFFDQKLMKLNIDFGYKINYSRQVANYTRLLDPSRPITAAIATPINDDNAVCFLLVVH